MSTQTQRNLNLREKLFFYVEKIMSALFVALLMDTQKGLQQKLIWTHKFIMLTI